MRAFRMMALAALIGSAPGIALAQGSGPGPDGAAGPTGAAAPASGPGMGRGPGGGRGMQRWGPDFTPGWSLMTAQERQEHQDRMRSMKTYEECKAYQAQHHEQMVARAKERGSQTPTQPRRDPCRGLKK